MAPHQKLLLADALRLPRRESGDGFAFGDPVRCVTHLRVLGVVVAPREGGFLLDDGTAVIRVALPAGAAAPPAGSLVDVAGALTQGDGSTAAERSIQCTSPPRPQTDPNYESLRAAEISDLYRTCYFAGPAPTPAPTPDAAGSASAGPAVGAPRAPAAGEKRKQRSSVGDASAAPPPLVLTVVPAAARELISGHRTAVIRAARPPWSAVVAGALLQVDGEQHALCVTRVHSYERAEQVPFASVEEVRGDIPEGVERESGGLVALQVLSLEPSALGRALFEKLPATRAELAKAFGALPVAAVDGALQQLQVEGAVYEMGGQIVSL